MENYEIIAFYRENKLEISKHAEAISGMYHLQLRYEKLPKLSTAISALLDEKTVFCILDRTIVKFRKLLKYIYALNKPVMVVYPNDSTNMYKHLKIPVGYLQENKEKVIWANFFQRKKSDLTIELVVPKEKDANIALMVTSNLEFIEKIFQNFNASYSKSFVEGSFEKTLKQLFKQEEDSIIFIMRPFRVFSFFIPYNIRLFRKYAHTPTMIIPRDENLYIPYY